MSKSFEEESGYGSLLVTEVHASRSGEESLCLHPKSEWADPVADAPLGRLHPRALMRGLEHHNFKI